MKSVRVIKKFLVSALASGAFSPVLASSLVSDANIEPAPNTEKHAVINDMSVSLKSFTSNVVVENVVTSLAFPKALTTVVDKMKRATHILIVTRDGELVIVDDSGKVSKFPLSLDNLYIKGQGGVLDILIPSQFPASRTVLLSYSKGSDDANRLAVVKGELSLSSGISNIESVFEVVQTKDTPVHYGGKLLQLEGSVSSQELGFLVTTGDGFDYREQAQVIGSQLGKVLGFSISGKPLMNPAFLESPYIYTLGHRNPQGLVQGPQGQIFLHEHGPDGGDEVNLLQKGANYGWPIVTLGKDYSGARISPFSTYPGMREPLVDWTPSIAPSSMIYYSDDQYPMLTNTLLVTSLKAKALYAVNKTSSKYVSTKIFDKLEMRLRDIAVDHQGNLLLLTDGENAKVVKVSPKQNKAQ
ncbi:PQQ-dependent sugar dehydrogenase [Alteromonas sp. S015]|uniref:PQQ-dependent sugar dehydrogenase n=1 Tax=Alteromonas sp. S015 TaxID=3117401 RepID=UPI002FDFDFA8